MPKTSSPSLLDTLAARFAAHMHRHPDANWAAIEKKLRASPKALTCLAAMEETGGEPDVVTFTPKSKDILFCDCAPESPLGRRSLCYDRAALDARKENKPKGSAVERAAEIGITLLTEAQYRHLQTLEAFDVKTSSWIATPPSVRKLGGALFCDRRYDTVFVYHNGAESYYAARGFRGLVNIG